MTSRTSADPTHVPDAHYDGRRYPTRDNTAYHVVRLALELKRLVEQQMVPLDLTDAQWRPLILLAEGHADTALELSRQMGCDAGALTRLLDRLETKGLVQRERSTVDRRVVHVRLTDAGRQAAAEVPMVLADINNTMLRGVDIGAWQQLNATLKHLHANVMGAPAAQTAAVPELAR